MCTDQERVQIMFILGISFFPFTAVKPEKMVGDTVQKRVIVERFGCARLEEAQ